jgi:hypothetical protein
VWRLNSYTRPEISRGRSFLKGALGITAPCSPARLGLPPSFSGPDGPEPSSSTGRAKLAERSRNALSAWEEYHIDADEYREPDDGRVLVRAHVIARGKASGVEVGQDVGRSG